MTRHKAAPSTPQPNAERAAARAAESAAKQVAAPTTPFAHASEAEFARILDFYGVRWEYEPHTFPILWNLEGGVAESFSPDFWLPDLELYVELTTLRQSLVRKKNRKLRRLRELYPDLRVKLFYGRDFRALMLKYGKVALVEGLSGALGQSTLARPAEVAVDGLPDPSESLGSPLVAAAEVPAVADASPMPTDAVAGDAAGAESLSPVDASAPDAAQPAVSTSRSARRRRRRRAAALLSRRSHPEEPVSQPATRHDPANRR
jgi:hypothetical protein